MECSFSAVTSAAAAAAVRCCLTLVAVVLAFLFAWFRVLWMLCRRVEATSGGGCKMQH